MWDRWKKNCIHRNLHIECERINCNFGSDSMAAHANWKFRCCIQLWYFFFLSFLQLPFQRVRFSAVILFFFFFLLRLKRLWMYMITFTFEWLKFCIFCVKFMFNFDRESLHDGVCRNQINDTNNVYVSNFKIGFI